LLLEEDFGSVGRDQLVGPCFWKKSQVQCEEQRRGRLSFCNFWQPTASVPCCLVLWQRVIWIIVMQVKSDVRICACHAEKHTHTQTHARTHTRIHTHRGRQTETDRCTHAHIHPPMHKPRFATQQANTDLSMVKSMERTLLVLWRGLL